VASPAGRARVADPYYEDIGLRGGRRQRQRRYDALGAASPGGHRRPPSAPACRWTRSATCARSAPTRCPRACKTSRSASCPDRGAHRPRREGPRVASGRECCGCQGGRSMTVRSSLIRRMPYPQTRVRCGSCTCTPARLPDGRVRSRCSSRRPARRFLRRGSRSRGGRGRVASVSAGLPDGLPSRFERRNRDETTRQALRAARPAWKGDDALAAQEGADRLGSRRWRTPRRSPLLRARVVERRGQRAPAPPPAVELHERVAAHAVQEKDRRDRRRRRHSQHAPAMSSASSGRNENARASPSAPRPTRVVRDPHVEARDSRPLSSPARPLVVAGRRSSGRRVGDALRRSCLPRRRRARHPPLALRRPCRSTLRRRCSRRTRRWRCHRRAGSLLGAP